MAEESDFLSHLRQVFDLCDESQRGFLDSDQLRELGRKHLGGREEDMVQLLQCLDPKGLGLITFPDFYRGVLTVMRVQGSGHFPDSVATNQGGKELSKMSQAPLLIGSPEEENVRNLSSGFNVSVTSNNNNTSSTNSIEKLVGLRNMDEDISIQQELSASRISPNYLSDGEERFECYGEGDDIDEVDGISNDQSCPDTPQLDLHVTKPSLSSDSFRSTSSIGSAGSGGGGRNSSARTTPFQQRNTWLRSSLRRQSGSSKRLSSNALASQLFRNGTSTPNGHSLNNGSNSRRSSLSCDSDEMYTDQISLEDDVLDLNQKVHELQQQVSTLSESQYNNDDRYCRVKQENAALMSRIHTLEEQIRELEIRSEERVLEEERRLKDSMARQEREKNQELEHFTSKLYTLQQEHLEVKEELIKIRGHAERLRQEKVSLENELADSLAELSALRSEHQRIQEFARREREEHAQERNGSTQLLTELNCEVEDLRRYRHEHESAAALASARSRSPSVLQDMPQRCQELEREVRQLREEASALREANEELQAQLLNNSLAEGKHLLAPPSSSTISHSLAEEFESLTKDQVMDALREQQEVNAKLRTYIDNILLNIVENYPQLLEVKSVLKN